MKTLNNFLVTGKNVLVRVDLNVPCKDGLVQDDTRLYAIKNTIDHLIQNKNKIFLLSHFGRPNGQIDKRLSLKFLPKKLANILSIDKILFCNTCFGEEVKSIIDSMNPGELCLFENVRFYKAEEVNDYTFAKNLAQHFDVFVNDAFSVSHRSHASIVGITKHLPSVAGVSLINEIENLNKFLKKNIKSSTAIIGGSKVSTKLKVFDNLIEIFDTLIVGGAMANTFLYSKGYGIGKSLVEKDLVDDVKLILKKMSNYNKNIILPIDLVCSKNLTDSTNIKIADIENILPDQIAFDIGNKTIETIRSSLLISKMILWNGPLGAFEYKPFDFGTNAIAETIKTDIYKLNITSIAGGGDTIAALKKTNAEKYFTYLSNGGGAFLEWLEGNESPGIKALITNDFY